MYAHIYHGGEVSRVTNFANEPQTEIHEFHFHESIIYTFSHTHKYINREIKFCESLQEIRNLLPAKKHGIQYTCVTLCERIKGTARALYCINPARQDY